VAKNTAVPHFRHHLVSMDEDARRSDKAAPPPPQALMISSMTWRKEAARQKRP
jgi:hypothetical protein